MAASVHPERGAARGPWLRTSTASVCAVLAVCLAAGVTSNWLKLPELPLLMALAGVALAATVRRPIWALFAMVLVLPIREPALAVQTPVGFVHAYRVVLVMIFVALALRAPARWYWRVARAPLTLPILTFVALAGGSVLVAVDKAMWAKSFVNMLVCLGVYVTTVLLVNTPRRFEATCKCLAVAGLVHSVIGIVDYGFYLKGWPSFTTPVQLLGTIDPPRAMGLTGDPNYYIMILLAALPLAVAWSLQYRRGPGRYLWALALALLILVMPMSMSRGGMLAACLLLLTAVLLGIGGKGALGSVALERTWRRIALSGLVLLAASLVGLFLWSPTHALRLARVTNEENPGSFGSGRADVYRSILAQIPEHPLGQGLNGTFSAESGVGRAAHNNFLQIVGDMGIPGLLAYLWLLWEILRNALRYHAGSRYSPWLVSIGLGILATSYSGLSLTVYFDEALALSWGLLMVGNMLAREELRGSADTRKGSVPQPAS